MKIKKVAILLIICICFACLIPARTFATDIDTIISGMKDVPNVNAGSTSGKIGSVLNAVIRLIQVAGTGVSVLTVTMLGIKYMLASTSEKADIKKMAMPIIVGCVLLFAAVNLVGIIASVGNGLNE